MSSRTVSPSGALENCGSRLIRLATFLVFMVNISFPSISTEPFFTFSTRDIVCSSVVLPQPFGPTIEVICPLGIVILKRSEEHTSELQSRGHLVCRLLLEKQ